MVQNNKVLTVSYGTFSCTLEGFDDSFETMKAIAEYFRDLAADDRYFGSEPPQPDAEMLTRIAQRDASKRVEARQSDTGLLLRATESSATIATPATPPAQEPTISAPDLNVVNTPQPAQPVATAEPFDAAPAPPADSIAAKLQRIRAVVSHSTDNPVEYSEDEDSTLLKGGAAPVDAVAAAFEAGALNPADIEPVTPVSMPAPEAATPPAAPEPVPAPEPVVSEEFEDEAEAPAADALFSDLDDLTEDEQPEAEAEEDEIVNILSEEDVAEQEEESEAVESQEEAAENNKRLLTAEDEVALLDEISAVEAELAQRAEDQKPKDHSSFDLDVSRLMDKADEQLDDPAANDQRETYSHLRTAVAATEAERKEKGESAEKAQDQEYRGDLASVVSPRRPEIQVTSMRPESDAAAPLKLVAEQRIDNQQNESGPVTPRRVTTPQEEKSADEGGFATFAQEQGAQSLPDLLEAAAAYLSFIEGQEQFSRPQLMNKVRSLKQDEFNREESLRSFGQLLRDGKIEKAGGGRFAASNQIGFRPSDERAAG